jgi:hypothetical protein
LNSGEAGAENRFRYLALQNGMIGNRMSISFWKRLGEEIDECIQKNGRVEIC